MYLKGALAIGALGCIGTAVSDAHGQMPTKLIDDFSDPELLSPLGTQWRGVSDKVMGGISEASIARTVIAGRAAIHISGDVRLENNGGFIQAALDLAQSGGVLDASAYTGLRLTARGNDQRYSVHLRTPDNRRPWQSYRAHFHARPNWETVDLPFQEFEPYRVETPLNTSRLRRIGLVAIGRAFQADFAVSEISLYR
jgi:hypothetical protein